MKGRLLGVDHGLARIGLAISDPSCVVARELAIIERTTRAADFAAIREIVERESVATLVVGIPHNDVPEGVHTHADSVRRWISRMQEIIPLPVVEWDESLTSDDAQSLAHHLRRPVRAPIDDLAARLMLQSYLDALRDGLAQPPTSVSKD